MLICKNHSKIFTFKLSHFLNFIFIMFECDLELLSECYLKALKIKIHLYKTITQNNTQQRVVTRLQ